MGVVTGAEVSIPVRGVASHTSFLLQQAVAHAHGSFKRELLALAWLRGGFQAMLFSKIVPNCKKLGLLDAGATNGKPGWLREKFTELGVIAFEDWADTGEEYEMFQLANGEVQSQTA